MERQPEEHLNSAEVDAILRSGDPQSGTEEADVSEARKHAESCNRCQFLLELQADQEGDFATSRPRSAAPRTAGCPREDEWPVLAGGLKHGREADTLLRHAAACEHCGPLLRQSLEDFAEDLTPAEEEFLASLESVRPNWPERMGALAAEEARRPWILGRVLRRVLRRVRQPLLSGVPVPAWAYAGLGVLVAVVLIVSRPPAVEDLLATAYTHQRTLELRIPEAAYGPLRLVKGSTDSSPLDRPPTVLESEATIARKLAEKPNDPRWLQARGRAEILDRDFESAIADLQRCLILKPDSPHLMTDLGCAYFERAEGSRAQQDYNAAIEFLNRALKMTPDDPVALFNRAIVYERMHFHGQAIEDWRHYLRVDPHSRWAAEARQRLAEAEQASTKTN